MSISKNAAAAVTLTTLTTICVLAISATPSQAAAAKKDEVTENHFALHGPSAHISAGVRFKQAPNLDTYDSMTYGLKISPLSLQFSEYSYISVLAPGISYIGSGRVAMSLSPIIYNHASGFGFGIDFYTTRPDRTGGPFGVSLNIDVMGVYRFAMRMMNR